MLQSLKNNPEVIYSFINQVFIEKDDLVIELIPAYRIENEQQYLPILATGLS